MKKPENPIYCQVKWPINCKERAKLPIDKNKNVTVNKFNQTDKRANCRSVKASGQVTT